MAVPAIDFKENVKELLHATDIGSHVIEHHPRESEMKSLLRDMESVRGELAGTKALDEWNTYIENLDIKVDTTIHEKHAIWSTQPTQYYWPTEFKDNELWNLCNRLAKLSKLIVHGHNYHHEPQGLNDGLLRDHSAVSAIKKFQIEWNYKKWDNGFMHMGRYSPDENIAHQIVRVFLHLPHEDIVKIIDLYVNILPSAQKSISKNDVMAQLHNIISDAAKNTFFTEQHRFVYGFMRDHTVLTTALHEGLMKLQHNVVFIEWCSEWKNMLLVAVNPCGPIHLLLASDEKHYVPRFISGQVDHRTGLPRHLYLKTLFDSHACYTMACMSEYDCCDLILCAYFSKRELNKILQYPSEHVDESHEWQQTLKLTEKDEEIRKKDLHKLSELWKQSQEAFGHKHANSKITNLPRQNTILPGSGCMIGGRAVWLQDDEGNNMYQVWEKDEVKEREYYTATTEQNKAKEKLYEENKKLEDLEKEIKKMQDTEIRNFDAEKAAAYKKLVKDISSLEQILADYQSELSEKIKAHSKAENKAAALQTEINNFKGKGKRAKADNDTTKTNLKRLKENIEASEKEIEELKRSVEATEKAIEDMQKEQKKAVTTTEIQLKKESKKEQNKKTKEAKQEYEDAKKRFKAKEKDWQQDQPSAEKLMNIEATKRKWKDDQRRLKLKKQEREEIEQEKQAASKASAAADEDAAVDEDEGTEDEDVLFFELDDDIMPASLRGALTRGSSFVRSNEGSQGNANQNLAFERVRSNLEKANANTKKAAHSLRSNLKYKLLENVVLDQINAAKDEYWEAVNDQMADNQMALHFEQDRIDKTANEERLPQLEIQRETRTALETLLNTDEGKIYQECKQTIDNIGKEIKAENDKVRNLAADAERKRIQSYKYNPHTPEYEFLKEQILEFKQILEERNNFIRSKKSEIDTLNTRIQALPLLEDINKAQDELEKASKQLGQTEETLKQQKIKRQELEERGKQIIDKQIKVKCVNATSKYEQAQKNNSSGNGPQSQSFSVQSSNGGGTGGGKGKGKSKGGGGGGGGG